ncbi:MAG: DNA mismatch repair protein MutT [Chloroflexota bacterium]|nr:MAG: DNA mismatch repair protein MutT [Chloroflexota bacterium]
MKPNKTCPVVVRHIGGELQILAFRHPVAGCQIIKGTIESGEPAAQAALRELFEESGIQSATVIRDLGVWESGYEGQIWSFHLCEVDELPDEWIHHTQDGGGHDFAFFWHSLHESPNDDWHPLFKNALQWIRTILTPTSM